jgi:broad specificity phosphatase PhoE
MEVTFLRHAQSIFNRDLTSKKDCELTDYGIEQAKQIKGNYDVILCSILKRAKQTLQYSELNSKQLHFTDLCREVRRDICDFLEEEDETKLETDQEVQKRIKLFKQFLKSKTKPGEKVLVICHRDFIHEIGDKKYPEPKNAELQTIQLE